MAISPRTARRRELDQLIGDLEAELDGLVASTAASPDDEHDPEGATIGFERARVQALLMVMRRRRALLASERRDSAHCQRCGDSISRERLRAVPGVRHCVGCASESTAPVGRRRVEATR